MKIRVDIDWNAPGDIGSALAAIRTQLEALRVAKSEGYRVVSVREWIPKWWEWGREITRTDGPSEITLCKTPEAERGRREPAKVLERRISR